jgi:HEAT repeat protein
MLIHQLENDPDCLGRIEAAHELSKLLEPEVVPALLKAAQNDKFWAVQAEACGALAEIRSEAALGALTQAVKTIAHARARRAAVRALGTYRDPKAAETLRKVAEKDASYYVEAEATWAYAESRLNPARSKVSERHAVGDDMEKFLHEQLAKPSYRELVRIGALKGMTLLPGIGRGERARALDTLIEWTGKSQPMDARTGAISALGAVGKSAVASERARILEVLDQLADEPNFRTRMALVSAVAALEHPDAIGILEKIRGTDLDGRVKREALSAAGALSTEGPAAESARNLRESVEKLEEEYRKLRSMVEETRASLKP